MKQSTLARLLGIAIIGLVILIALIADAYGVVKLLETVMIVWALLMGVGLIIGFQLLFRPESILGSTKTQEHKSSTTSDTERTNFKHALVQELKGLLEKLRTPMTTQFIPEIEYVVWNTKTDDEKGRLIGAKPYYLLQTFFERVDYRNTYSKVGQSIDAKTYDANNTKCLEVLKNATNEIEWLTGLFPPSRKRQRKGDEVTKD